MAKVKLLVVDDNPFICKLMTARLTANDYEVVIATSGQEGLNKAEAEKPDLIILDVNMPDIDGIEVGKRLRENNATKAIPIIMATARDEHAVIVQAMESFSPAAYVVKPFNPEKLLETIEKVLKIE